MGELPKRKWLNHDVPSWVKGDPDFFVTVCARERGGTHLLDDRRAEGLIESAQFQHAKGLWFVHCFVVMPDHVHLLLAIHPNSEFKKTFADWKRYTSRTLGTQWQEGFFEHRISNSHELAEKWQYIVANPVRAGLASSIENWPYWFETR